MSERPSNHDPQHRSPVRSIRNTDTHSDQGCCGCCGYRPSSEGRLHWEQPFKTPTVCGHTAPLTARLAYSVDEAAHLLSVGRDSIYELIRTGQLRTFKIGARRLVALRDIEAFVDQAEASA